MNQVRAVGKLTDTYLRYGIVPVGKKSRLRLGLPAPTSKGSVKMEVLFDSGRKKQLLVYDPVGERFFGVKGWYTANLAKKGDQVAIEVIIPGQRYRFHFISDLLTKSAAEQKARTPITTNTKRDRNKSVVGQPINYRNLMYGPVNEQGVVLLFGMLFEELGMIVEEVKTGFPDATVRRFNGKGWVRERVEFEYVSLNFKKHKHPVDECDIIVCWKHNWTQCPLEVIDLIKYIPFSPTANTMTRQLA